VNVVAAQNRANAILLDRSVRERPFPDGAGCEDVRLAPKSGRRFAAAGRASLAVARARRRLLNMAAIRIQGIRMTRIHGAGAYPAPPALDSAAGVAATSRPARVSRSKASSSLMTPGAPDVLAAKSSGTGSRARIASPLLFAGDGAPSAGGQAPVPEAQPDAGAALFVTISQLCRPGHDRLDPMFTYRLRGAPSSVQARLFKLAAHPRMAGDGGPAWKAQALRDVIATAGVMDMPVVLYCDVDAAAPGPLEALFAMPATRATAILWAHCGGVGRFVGKPVDHAGYLRSVLADPSMGHVHVDLSWPRMARRIMVRAEADGRAAPDHASVRAWARLIDDHPDRFLFGSEALGARERAAAWKAIDALYRPLLDMLSPAARRAVTTGNYARLVLDARSRMRAFARHVLTPAFVERDLRAWELGRGGGRFDPDALRAARDAAYAGSGVAVAAPARQEPVG
jgi:hypothetical protein